MDDKLFKAILAMDSYNRGYDAQLTLPDAKDTKIGNAKIYQTSTVLGPGVDKASNFYAIAYTYGTEKVISYRGTDSVTSSYLFNGDLWNGWGVGAGSAQGKQAELALKFYQSVAGGVSNALSANISLTGHSLGGGLAGLVGALYSKKATVFDPMPFQAAAQNTYNITSDAAPAAVFDAKLRQLVYGTGFTSLPSLAKLEGISMKGEVLEGLRNTVPYTIDHKPYTLGSGTAFGKVDLHSQATLVIRMFMGAESPTSQPWDTASTYLWKVLYDGDFAKRIGMNISGKMLDNAQGGDVSQYAGILRTVIAYSALENEGLLFGNTGIRALYDDANALGAALKADAVAVANPFIISLGTYAADISKALVQYAGILALKKIESAAFADAVKGVVDFDATVGKKLLTVNFDDALWKKANKDSTVTVMAARDDLVNHVINDTGEALAIKTAMTALWANNTPFTIDRVVFGVSDNGALTISNKVLANTKATLYVGHDGNDDVTGSSGNDLIIGGNGDDQLRGGAGNDILMGGADNDVLLASTGLDKSYGNEGDDIFFVESTINQSLWFDGGDDKDLVYLADQNKSDFTEISPNIYTSNANPNIILEFNNVETVIFGNDLFSYSATSASIHSLSGAVINPDVYAYPWPNERFSNDLAVNGDFKSLSTMLGYVTGAKMEANLKNSYVSWDMYRGSPSEFIEHVTLSGTALIVDRVVIKAPSGMNGYTEFSVIIDETTGGYWGKNLYNFDNPSGVLHVFDISTAETGYAGKLQYYYTGLNRWYDVTSDFDKSEYNYANSALANIWAVAGSSQREVKLRFTGDQVTFDYYLMADIGGLGHTGINSGNNYSGYGFATSKFVLPQGANFISYSGFSNSGFNIADIQKNWSGTSNNDIFTGASFSETVFGYDGNDNIRGDKGNDVLLGGADDDTIDGGADNDIVKGESGNDTLEGGSGNDELDGGAGNDTLSYQGATAAVRISLSLTSAQNTGGAGTDTIGNFENLMGSGYNDTLSGNAGNNILNGGSGTDTLSYANATAAVTVNLGITAAQNTLGAGTDTISNFENLTGSAYNDILTGSSGNNVLNGGNGNDTISGGAGNDILYGDAGNDRLDGGTEIDTASYASASAAVNVSLALTTEQNTLGAGLDTLVAIENLIGSKYNDTLTGDANANMIEGGLGNDIMNGGTGIDTLSYASSAAAVTVNLGITTAQNTGGAGTDTISNFENLTGSAYNDLLVGNSGANTILGGNGNDNLQGGLGNDTLDGGAGTDMVSYSGAAAGVTVNLSVTTAQNTVSVGTDILLNFEKIYGSAYNDTLTGNASANTIEGSGGNDTISGGAGNDILYGDAGSDILYGGTGADKFMFNKSTAFSGVDQVMDFKVSEGDKLDIANILDMHNPATDPLAGFVRITESGTTSSLWIDADGGGNGFVKIADLYGITTFTGGATATEAELQALVSSGVMVV